MNKWFRRSKNLSKTQLARKMSVSRVDLNKLLSEYKSSSDDFKPFSRQYANNGIITRQRIDI
jgi:transcriptional regulator with XRE-family HTH domain